MDIFEIFDLLIANVFHVVKENLKIEYFDAIIECFYDAIIQFKHFRETFKKSSTLME